MVYWGDGTGRIMLGQILMRVREGRRSKRSKRSEGRRGRRGHDAEVLWIRKGGPYLMGSLVVPYGRVCDDHRLILRLRRLRLLHGTLGVDARP